MNAAEIQAAVAELDRKAKTIHPGSFAALTTFRNRFLAAVYCFGRAEIKSEAPTAREALDQVEALLAEHDPDMIAKTLGLDTFAQPKPETAS